MLPLRGAERGEAMLAGLAFLVIGAVLGAFLRLPGFMAAAVFVLACYAFIAWDQSLAALGFDMLIGLLAIQIGYALAILGRLFLKDRRSNLGGSSDKSERI